MVIFLPTRCPISGGVTVVFLPMRCPILGGVMVIFIPTMLFQSIPFLFWCPILGGLTVLFILKVLSLQSILVFIHLHHDSILETHKLQLDTI